MPGESKRWIMKSRGAPLGADDELRKPAADEVLIEIDSCSLWSSDVGFQYGEVRGGQEQNRLQYRVSGHVVEAGDNALFFADRPVALAASVPCGQSAGCLAGTVAACPNKSLCGDGSGASILAPARDVDLAEKHPDHPIGPGLVPFNDG